jgi:hypothetical protein
LRTELAKVRTSGLTEEEQEWVLAKSALQVYRLPIGNDGK